MGPRRTKAETKKLGNGFFMVMARGFQWKVSKKDVMEFFKGINILNGEKGINIMKNVAMEAYIELASKNDVKKALAYNNKRVDSRTVHGEQLSIRISFKSGFNSTILSSFSEQLLKSIQRNTHALHHAFRKQMKARSFKSEVYLGRLTKHTSWDCFQVSFKIQFFLQIKWKLFFFVFRFQP